MKEKHFELSTTFSGRTYKFNKNPKANLLIDLPNNIIIGISSSISCIDCYLPDEDEVYHYAGDISFGNDDGTEYIQIHSRAISALNFNNEKVPIPEKSDSLTNVKVNLNVDKSKKWFDSLSKKF